MQKTVFDETHYAILERLNDGKVHFPFREMKIYDGHNTLLCPNEIEEKAMQMADKDLPLVAASGGDAYFHARIEPLGRAFYQELHIGEDQERFTNPEECEAVTPEMTDDQRTEAEKKLFELSRKLGL
jgi:hypothetical protein